MLSIIYPYRNRDLRRIKNSFDSLQNQTTSAFDVYFIDYGSPPDIANEVQELCEKYPFVSYMYAFTQFQPWNKSRALNFVIKKLATEEKERVKSGAVSTSCFCFVADVDMIFHPAFVETAIKLQKLQHFVYFQVGWLTSNDAPEQIKPEEFDGYRKSTPRATGLSMFPVRILEEVRGFDEFYHFWGAEDSDIHVRLINAGYQVKFYDQKALMLHQWHQTFKLSMKRRLSMDYQVEGIVELNKKYLLSAKESHRMKINVEQWGEVMTEEDFNELVQAPVQQEILNRKSDIDAFLFGYMPGIKDKIIKVKFVVDSYQYNTKYKLKRIFNKAGVEYYSLKDINDKLLLHLISFYRNKPYNFEVSEDLKSISLAIKL